MLKLLNFKKNIAKIIINIIIINFFIMTSEAISKPVNLPAGLDPQNTIIIELKDGNVLIELLPKVAPKHVERIKTLTKQKFYDGIVFHRVIDGFMAQTGDPTGTGMGGSKLPNLKAEFSDEPHIRGALSMARASNPDSANSQFFIVTKDSRFLDRQYTVWGRVVSGMEIVDKIKKGDQNFNGEVKNPDKMIKVYLASESK
jgi:peptidylprolyl isomerase